MKQIPRILFVEDDDSLGFVTRDNLLRNGFEVDLLKDGNEGLKAFMDRSYDLCILDVMLPKMDGFTLARKIRKRNENIPILFLTARSMQEDRIEGLKTGADDYLTKPFHMEELVLKLRVFIKRSGNIGKSKKYRIGSYLFDPDSLSLTSKNESQNLTQKENSVLKMLCDKKGEVLKREEILKSVWGDDDYFMGRSLDVYISKLRKYLHKDPSIKIENFHGVGFKLVENN